MIDKWRRHGFGRGVGRAKASLNGRDLLDRLGKASILALAGGRCLAAALAERARQAPAAALLTALSLLLGLVAPIVVALLLVVDVGLSGPRRVGDVIARFERLDYDLRAVTAPGSLVPRIFLKRLPQDWRRLVEAEPRKRAFIMILLPLVLLENGRVLRDRSRLLEIKARRTGGQPVASRDRAWLERLALAYGLESVDLKELTGRVDAVPASLAIAQAAIESGWGTSRFAVQGNALFGQWADEGRRTMVPSQREAERRHAIRRFKTLGHSVRAYLRNLNTPRAYRAFRLRRAKLRAGNLPLDGVALAQELISYSQQGPAYVRALHRLIVKNDLAALDGARLQP
jgi:Bax protein